MSTEKVVARQNVSYRDSKLIEFKDALRKNGVTSRFEFSEQFLLKFLRARLYNVHDSSILIEKYVANFKKCPEFVEGVECCRSVIENGIFQLFPCRNDTGEIVTCFCLKEWSESEASHETVGAAIMLGIEMAELDEETQRNGVIIIIDFGHIDGKQLMKLSVSLVRLLANINEKSLPVLWKKIFVCNENSFLIPMFKMAKPFLSKQLYESVEFIGEDYKRMHKVISPEVLPPKYGGCSDDNDPKLFLNALKSKENELLKLWTPFRQL